jgi:tRNA 2-selenouridine synthase
MNIGPDHFAQLFIHNCPLLDVRAPVEFTKGAFPGSQNIPLLADDEREAVGIAYARRGPAAAVALGYELVHGDTKTTRLMQWAQFAQTHPHGALYCFRGGMRSQIVQGWLRDDMGIELPRVLGGYKALRRFLVDTLDRLSRNNRWMLLGGFTGSGKTDLIGRLANGVDLEALANHRGSSFGRRLGGQPSQIDFENRLAIALLKSEARVPGCTVVEDEGAHVGTCSVPLAVREACAAAPLVWVDVPRAARRERILHDYVLAKRRDYQAAFPAEEASSQFTRDLTESLARLRKRLGGERHARATSAMNAALSLGENRGDEAHLAWIDILLDEYYDPMYAHHYARNEHRLSFRGDPTAVRQYLAESNLD